MQKIELAYIIDDDEIIIHLTGELIKKANFCERTETFTDCLQALERLKYVAETGEKLPDVILFDINMPVMDGWEFMDEYHQLPLEKEIPLFVFTASITTEDYQKSRMFKNIKGFIQKPLTVIKLVKILRLIS
jgi:CheY-like chemotaxis protein